MRLAFLHGSFDGSLGYARRDLELLVIAERDAIPAEALGIAVELAEEWTRRSIWVVTESSESLQRCGWYLDRALRQPRTFVFGDEARLEALLLR